MIKLSIPKYEQILRINPATDPRTLQEFKKAVRCVDGKGFDLNGIKEEPQELVQRSYSEVVATSSEARKKSRKLHKKYKADNILDWRRENWHGVTCNVESSIWFDDYTIYLYSEENLSPLIIELAKIYKIELYFSFVEDCDDFYEDNCGLLKIKGFPEYFELGTDRFEKLAFASALKYRMPMSLKEWEEYEIPITNIESWYVEHFIEPDAQKRLEAAFNETNHVCVANTMVNEEIGSKRVWEALSKLF